MMGIDSESDSEESASTDDVVDLERQKNNKKMPTKPTMTEPYEPNVVVKVQQQQQPPEPEPEPTLGVKSNRKQKIIWEEKQQRGDALGGDAVDDGGVAIDDHDVALGESATAGGTAESNAKAKPKATPTFRQSRQSRRRRTNLLRSNRRTATDAEEGEEGSDEGDGSDELFASDDGNEDEENVQNAAPPSSPGAHSIPGRGRGRGRGRVALAGAADGEGESESETTATATAHEGSRLSATTTLFSAVLIDEDEENARRELVLREKIKREAAVASAVVEEDVATTLQQQQQREQKKRRRRRLFLGMVCLLMAVVVIAVVVSVMNNDNDGIVSTSLSPTPTVAPTPISEEDLLLQLFGPISGMEELTTNHTNETTNETASSASYQAMQWMLQQDLLGQVPIKLLTEQQLTDRFALATFYFATNGPTDWIDQAGFLSDLSVCEWPQAPLILTTSVNNTTSSQGREELLNKVDCNDDGRVISVKFRENNTTGNLPKELFAIDTMEELMVQTSNLKGTLPKELGALTLLTALSFNSNQLSGGILDNDAWERLRFLQWLDLGSNFFTGTVPSALTGHEALRELRLFENFFEGTLPEFASRSLLSSVLVWNCDLSGPLPLSLFSLRQLEVLDVYSNSFTGTLSTRIGNLAPNLWWLELSYNFFQGPIPSELGLLTQLRFLTSHGNSFNSSLPSTIGNMDRLAELGLIRTVVTGTIPSEIGQLGPSLKRINMFGNKLTGTIPTEIGRLTNLNTLVLASNLLSGTVPSSEMQDLSSLLILRVGNNTLTGDLDDVVCSLPRLAVGDYEADCLPLPPSDIPEINCTCCTKCCNDLAQCEATNESESMRRCLGLIDVVEAEYSPTPIACTCTDVSSYSSPQNPVGQSSSVDLRCVWQDEQCTSCNAESDVCATNTVIGGVFYDDNENRLVGASSYTEFHYITSGSNNKNTTTIRFEYGSSAFNGNWCQFSVDGQLCVNVPMQNATTISMHTSLTARTLISLATTLCWMTMTMMMEQRRRTQQ